MNATVYQHNGLIYWRSETVAQCGPFDSYHEAMSNALGLTPTPAAPPLAASTAGRAAPHPPGS